MGRAVVCFKDITEAPRDLSPKLRERCGCPFLEGHQLHVEPLLVSEPSRTPNSKGREKLWLGKW